MFFIMGKEISLKKVQLSHATPGKQVSQKRVKPFCRGTVIYMLILTESIQVTCPRRQIGLVYSPSRRPRVKRVKHYAATIAGDASHDKEGGKTQNKEQLDAPSL